MVGGGGGQASSSRISKKKKKEHFSENESVCWALHKDDIVINSSINIYFTWKKKLLQTEK